MHEALVILGLLVALYGLWLVNNWWNDRRGL